MVGGNDYLAVPGIMAMAFAYSTPYFRKLGEATVSERTNQATYQSDRRGGQRLKSLLRGIFSSFLITVPIAVILSVAMAVTDFPEEYMSPAVLITVALSIILSGIITTAPEENLGWVGGSLAGLFYMLVITVVRWCLESRVYLDKDIVTLLLCGALLGTISGMAGLSLGQRIRGIKRRKRRKNAAPIYQPKRRPYSSQ